jgi:hypothetical protein
MSVRKDCLVDVYAAAKIGAQTVTLTLPYKTLADGKSTLKGSVRHFIVEKRTTLSLGLLLL